MTEKTSGGGISMHFGIVAHDLELCPHVGAEVEFVGFMAPPELLVICSHGEWERCPIDQGEVGRITRENAEAADCPLAGLYSRLDRRN